MSDLRCSVDIAAFAGVAALATPAWSLSAVSRQARLNGHAVDAAATEPSCRCCGGIVALRRHSAHHIAVGGPLHQRDRDRSLLSNRSVGLRILVKVVGAVAPGRVEQAREPAGRR